jgi:hypothetical protein
MKNSPRIVEKLLLILALLAIAFLIAISLLIFGATTNTLLILLAGIIESIISVLVVFVFRNHLFGSLDNYPLQKDVLEKLEAISKQQAAASDRMIFIEKQLKKQKKDIASIKKIIDTLGNA